MPEFSWRDVSKREINVICSFRQTVKSVYLSLPQDTGNHEIDHNQRLKALFFSFSLPLCSLLTLKIFSSHTILTSVH